MAAATTGSPSNSQPTQNDVEQPHPETPHPPNSPPQQQPPLPETLDPPISPKLQQQEDNIMILDEEDVQQPNLLPQPIVLTDDTEPLSPPRLTSPRNNQRRGNKRKKKTYRRPTMKKIQSLTENLNLIPFVPAKKLDLDKYEDVLKRLGLYEFSKIEFDGVFRTDLMVQLIVSYDKKGRGSYVNDVKVNVNRADLAKALKLPAAKKDRGSGGVEEVCLDSEEFDDEAIEFIEDFVFNWVILRGDGWVMPREVAEWTRCIRDGYPEKLDCASLIWFNVEKELSQGGKLVDCYYASHLQYLMRSQKDVLFMEKDGGVGEDGVGEEGLADDGEENVKGDDGVADDCEVSVEVEEEQEERDEKDEKEEEEEEEKVCVVQEQSVELTLGTEINEMAHEEVRKDDEIVMADVEEGNEEMEEQGGFKGMFGDHFLQRCQSSGLNNFEEFKAAEVDVDVDVEDEQIEQVEDEDEEEEGGERMDDGFEIEANDDAFDRDGLTDNFLQGVETSHNPYNSHGMSSMDLFGSRDDSFMAHGGPSFYNNGGKRVMDPEEDIHYIDQNKRLKTGEIWEEKQNDIGFCFEQMQQLMHKAKIMHEAKEQSYENLQYSSQLQIGQLQERQQLMETVIKSKDEELNKKCNEVFRLEREIYLMEDLLAGYRKALNDTRSKFSEYRKRAPLYEEPLYKDAGPGGLVLSTREIEKRRLKQEEDMMKIQMLAKNFEEDCVYQLELQNDRLGPMTDRLVLIETEMRNLKEIARQPKETHEPSAEMDVQPEETHEPSVEMDVQPEETHEPSAEMDVQPEETHEPSDKMDVQPEETREPSAELDVQPEETREPTAELDILVEPEENQKLSDKDDLYVEPGKNQASVDGNELSVEAQKSEDEIPENVTTMESLPLDADKSEEKGGSEEH